MTRLSRLLLILGVTGMVALGASNASGQRSAPPVKLISDQLLKRVIVWKEPAYPPIARQMNAGGPAVIDLVVDEKGNVISAKVVLCHPLLRASLLQAARSWKFRPSFRNGRPVKTIGTITYDFPTADELTDGKTLQELEREVSNHPASAPAHYNLGVAYEKALKHEEAMTHLREATRLDPSHFGANLKLGHVLARLAHTGRTQLYKEALTSYEQADRLKPDSSEVLHAMGLVYYALGDLERAVRAFTRSLEVEEPVTASHFMLGKAFVLQDKLEEAVSSYRRGLSLWSDSSMGHFGLGEAYLLMEKYDLAIAELKLSLKLSDGQNSGNSHFLLGLAYLKSGARESALKEYEILKKLDPDLAAQLIELIRKSTKRSDVS